MIASCPTALLPEPPSLARVPVGAEAAFRDALIESLHGLEVGDRNLLRFHYAHGLTEDRLAEVLCRPRATVVRQLARIRERMLRETRRSLAARLVLDKHELDRLLEVARRRFDFALARLLRPTTSANR
jgi:RNA polymerase sigma-70 factor, ECF subfamily